MEDEAIKNSQATSSKANKDINDTLDKDLNLTTDKTNILKVFDGMTDYMKSIGDNRVFNESYINFQRDFLQHFVDKAIPFFKSDLKVKIFKNNGKDLEGSFNRKTNMISIYLNPKNKNKMSATEVYIHELTHAISEYVLSSNDLRFKPLKDELLFLQNRFLEIIKNPKNLDMRVKLSHKLGISLLI